VFEDWVSALFQVSRFYVHRGVELRPPENKRNSWGEYDLIAQRFDVRREAHAVEAKSGVSDLGPAEVLKWRGKLALLDCGGSWWQWDDGPARGAPVSRQVPPDIRDRLERSGLIFVAVCDTGTAAGLAHVRALISDTPPRAADQTTVDEWRYNYWVVRSLADTLTRLPQPLKDDVSRFWQDVTSGLPLMADPVARLERAWAHWSASGPLVGRLDECAAKELARTTGLGLGSDALGELRKALALGTRSASKSQWLAARELWFSAWLRHTLRMMTLDAAVQCIAEDVPEADLRGVRPGLPGQLRALREIQFVERLPQFWQAFSGPWGGWVSNDSAHRNAELRAMCQSAGLPFSSGAVALETLDRLMVSPGGRYLVQGLHDHRTVVYHPPPMKALGHFTRLNLEARTSRQDQFPAKRPTNCAIWTNALERLLLEKSSQRHQQ